MVPLYFTIDHRLKIKIVPETVVEHDGHPILTYHYKIFMDEGIENGNGDYLGYLTFEKPGSLFTYTADGDRFLNSEEITELVEELSHFRDHPELWRLNQ